jgi:hypothetical protein
MDGKTNPLISGAIVTLLAASLECLFAVDWLDTTTLDVVAPLVQRPAHLRQLRELASHCVFY